MHDDLKALLRAGWSFGIRHDRDGDCYRATAKLADGTTVRGVATEPLEALARSMLEAQMLEAKR